MLNKIIEHKTRLKRNNANHNYKRNVILNEVLSKIYFLNKTT